MMIDDLLHPRHAHLRQRCAERGIAIRRRGEAWLLEGGGVRLFVADLRLVHAADLKPARDYARANGT